MNFTSIWKFVFSVVRTIKNSLQTPLGILLYRFFILLLLYGICRLLFYLFNTGLFPGVTAYDLFIMQLGGMRFDISAILYINSLYFLLQIIPFQFRHRPKYQKGLDYIFYTTNSIGLALNCIDLIYYRFTLRRTTFIVFDEFKNEENYRQLAYHFLTDYFYIFLIWIGLIYFMIFLSKRIRVRQNYIAKKYKYYIVQSSAFLVVPVLMIIGIRSGLPPKQDFPLVPSDAGQYVKRPNDIAIVQNTPFCMMVTLTKTKFVKQHYFDDATLDSLYSPIHNPDPGLQFNPKNVVVIIVESLGKETLGVYNRHLEDGHYRGYTPFLDSLAEHSLVFLNSYANGRISIEGCPSILSSIPSLQESFTHSFYYTNNFQSLPGLLAKKGYSSLFAHGAPNGSLGLNAYSVAAGFETYIGKNEYNNNKDYDGVWGIWDHLFLPFFANQCARLKMPFIATVFTTSSHHPYKIPKELSDRFRPGTLPIHRSIRYADYSLREFFREAAKQPWYDNTIFVITGDHTCEPYHAEYKTTVGNFGVPLIFFTPDESLKGFDTRTAQHIDILPTVLSYLNYNEPFFAFGKNLSDTTGHNIAIHYTGNSFQLIWDNWVIQHNMKNTVALYDLSTDRLLKNNLAGKNPEVQWRMEQKVKAVIQQYNNRMIENRMTPGK
jgi:phosphoglycerol transferase MdoB-like AlkP superfamily enzyme